MLEGSCIGNNTFEIVSQVLGKTIPQTEAYMLPPENTPALPTPEIARPIMKAADEGAEADTAEPTAKTRKEVIKIYFMGYSVYN